MPKTISIDEITEDMELNAAVSNKFGQILIPAGVLITEKHKKILKTWNISSVEIKSDEQESQEVEISQDFYDLAIGFVKKKIKWEAKNKYEEELIAIAIKSTAIAFKKGELNA